MKEYILMGIGIYCGLDIAKAIVEMLTTFMDFIMKKANFKTTMPCQTSTEKPKNKNIGFTAKWEE